MQIALSPCTGTVCNLAFQAYLGDVHSVVKLDHLLRPYFWWVHMQCELCCQLQVLNKHSESGLSKEHLLKKVRQWIPVAKASAAELLKGLQQVSHTLTPTQKLPVMTALDTHLLSLPPLNMCP